MKPSETPFAARVIDELKPHLVAVFDDPRRRQELGESLMAELLGKAVSTPTRRPMTDRQMLMARLLKQISLLTDLLEAVGMTAIFIRRFPYPRTSEARGISKVAYLRYHYEHYLHEVYRIREALVTTVKVVEKDARGHAVTAKHKSRVRMHFQSLEKAILEGFDGVARKRGRVVHEELYSDTELGRLDILHFYVQRADDAFKAMAAVHDEAYREKRATLAREIESSRRDLETAVAGVFAQLLPLVFDAESAARDP